MNKLSAVIITFNEERNIGRCIESLQEIADEIVVVDSFSTDKTIELCESRGVKVIQNKFEGHIQQKNFALQQAKNDWVISLDADEAVTEELKESILEVLKNPTEKGYKFNRLTNYCGKWVRFCGWYPDTKLRLVNRNFAIWQGVNPHDKLELRNGLREGFLKGDLLHYSYYTKEDHYKQIEYFGKIAAKEAFKNGKQINPFLLVVKVSAQFVKSYILKLGILDGITGLKISYRSAY
ncbi:MAG: glycosyltransferase family 2 protein, partial [Crocinitomicaceae bacterium]